MKRFWVILITIFGFFSFGLQAQNARREVRLGNKEYLNGEYQEAELFYRKALEDPQNFKDEALFNLGNALYRQDNFDAAGGSWAMAADLAVEKNQKSQAFYNLGNSLMSKQEFEKAIQAYKESLRKNPANEDARYNLEYAKKMLKQQEQQNQEQQNQEQQNQEQQNQEQQNQEQQNQEQQNQEQQNQEQQNKEQ
ncbi:MAG: tetratricopeptide repeat protein, partial [Bacteroidales bacterium]|nr:tetratricopeptide repeat protein [Bacteroidales bacterium]